MKKILIISFAFITFGACTDLEVDLYDKIPADKFPENDVQAALLTEPVYRPLSELLDWGGWWFAQEITTDEVTMPTRLTDWDDGGKWRALHQHSWTNTTEPVAAMWSRFYRGVAEANYLIEALEPGIEVPATATAYSKMRIMRSYYYYLLIDNYGNVPYVTSFATAPALPEKEDRATIFNNLITEMTESIPYLDNSVSKTAVNKGMAFSLLAKLYLNHAVYTGTVNTNYWKLAEDACDSVIALGVYSLQDHPLDPFVTENQTSPENIFTIPFDEDAKTGFNLHMRTLHYQSNLTFDMPVGPWNGLAVMEDHFNSYEADDKRKEGFLVGQQFTSTGQSITDLIAKAPLSFNPEIPALLMDGTYSSIEIRMSGARCAKFEIKLGAKDNLSNDFPLFRYADVLLMKAEARLRQGLNGDQWVNEIRSRAGVDPMSNITLDQILEERGREMFFEAHRRQDLIRFGKFNDEWWEKTETSAERNIFPIPQSEIDANPNLAK